MFNLNLKAVIYGVLTFVGLYFINILVVQLLLSATSDVAAGGANYAYMFLSQLMGVIILLVPGFLAGRIANERGFIHGAVTGAIGTLLTALAALIVALFRSRGIPISGTLFFWLIMNSMLCGFGGMAAEKKQ
jgi:putative membrane protein (TIGR04086 family)